MRSTVKESGSTISAPTLYEKTPIADRVEDRSIGSIISQANNLSAEQLEAILVHQRKTGQRFGEAAVNLGFIREKDVIWALAQQYQYPYRNKSDKAKSDELVVANEPFCEHAELFRNLRSQLLIKLNAGNAGGPVPDSLADRRGHCIAVVSANRGDGKTFTASNMALTFAQLGGKVALIDCDMRNARIQGLFNLSDRARGLSEALSGRADAELYLPFPEFNGLYVLPSGIIPPNPQELVERPNFAFLLTKLRQKFDYIIVDTPAADIGVDCIAIASRCDGALIVARRNSTTAKAYTHLHAFCDRASINVLGTVLNEY